MRPGLCIATMLSAGVLQAQVFRAPATGLPDTIPFTLSAANDLLVRAVLNGQDPLTLMFHSGVEGLSLTEVGREKAPSFRTSGSMDVGSWGGTAEVDAASDQTLTIGDRTWTALDVHVGRHSAVGSDGKFGHDLFAGQVVEVDFDRQVLVVHDRMPDDVTGYQVLTIERQGSSLLLKCVLTVAEDRMEQPVMLHTGYHGALILGTEALEAHGLAGRLDTLGVEVLTDAQGNELRNLRTRIPEFQLGEATFHDVPASIMDARSNFPMSVLGNEITRRFNWLLDLEQDVLYLRPNRNFDAPWPAHE